MKVKDIEYEVPPQDLVNGCLDVFVTLEDDSFYFVEVTTPAFLTVLMEEEEGKFLSPGYPYIIVSKLSDDIIRAAIQKFINEEEDSYWLKLYHITATLDIKDIDEILDRRKEKEEKDLELNLIIEAEIDAEMKTESNTNNRVLLETISFLGLASLISYCVLKPEVFDFFSSIS